MAEEKVEAGGVEITVGEKTTGEKAAEAAPFYGNYLKTAEAAGKTGEPGGVEGLTSEGSALISSVATSATSIAMDPLGWLIGQGLNFLISVVQPLEDAIHFVSGDGPALAQAAENFNAIGQGVADLRKSFDQDLRSTVRGWEGESAEAAAERLGQFANGVDGVAGQAGELAQLLQISSMIMTVVEDVIKAILTELITWLIMIWIPALAAAIPTAGGSTAAAGAATGVRVATSAGRVARIVAKLRGFLTKIVDFLRKLVGRMRNIRPAFRKAMADRAAASRAADARLAAQTGSQWQRTLNSPLDRLMSKDGLVGERVQQGAGRSFAQAARGELEAQVMPLHEKGARNQAGLEKQAAYGETGTDRSKQSIKGDLDL
ncbi:WXG100 family type VII secretion target [Actinosynnema pretiosum subsp. pretiosum]|uniref:WXG100 family type VII secretion target n=1 Tax=Actinosynnema pretiosum subsp. pretiosum TaxID=103721 RepID=A0AA45L584_9PSEU|nr:YD repeat protein [Actinosynnema pretiosum subsp. pretiosum]QUF03521.1 WXG100 family type VII secretion target [Actinosynnema pretiosum subsp. pretiosum]